MTFREAKMIFLEDRIRKDGKVYPGNILKVDSFLNHQIDIAVSGRHSTLSLMIFWQQEV